MNAERYLEVLEDTIVHSLCDIGRDRDIGRDQAMIFLQDGAPPHYATATAVLQFLNDEFQGGGLDAKASRMAC